jgi:hypothetical protein
MITPENSRIKALYSKVENCPGLTPLYNAEVALEEAYDLPFVKKIQVLQEQISYLETFYPKIRINGVPRKQRAFQNVKRALTALYLINQNQYEQQY